GTWYNYLSPPATFSATGGSQSITLLPGEYRVYLNSQVVLPVSLLNFSGRNNGNINVLNWEVANEINLSGYELQRSENGRDFSTVYRTAANGSQLYTFTDTDIKLSQYFYRLKSIDLDGSSSTSSIIKLVGPVTSLQLAATPNPFSSNMKISIATPVKSAGTLTLTDLSGKQVWKRNVNLLPGVNNLEIENLRAISAGTYILNLLTPEKTLSIRVMKSL
ncbi:MAG: T9SS type A sorting domain-containing protein, partial [Chitinophagaceae bacterium]